MYAHPVFELKAVSRLLPCRICTHLPNVAFGAKGSCTASCQCGLEVVGHSLMLVALAWNNRQERPVSGPFVRGELYDVHRSEVFIGSSFRVRLTHGDLATFNRWIGAVCGVEARSADHVGSDFYYLLSAEDEATSLPGGLVVRNGSVVEIWFSEFIEAGINASAQRALAEIQELVDRALNAVA